MTRARWVGALAAMGGAALLAAAAPAGPPPLRAMRWLAPGVDVARVLTRRPAECLGQGGGADDRYEIELGRAAFRTPLLLGGQAARAGIACETCHRSGGTNPDFDFPGVSGAPGTADVRTAVLSSHEPAGPLDPLPIPNLSGPKSALRVDQDPASGQLEALIDGIVTREFDGAPPPPAVLNGLAAYVRALSPAACPASPTEAVTAAGAIDDARRAVRAAIAALGHGDPAAAILMVEAARSQLGDIDERYAAPGLAAQRQALMLASLDLAAAEAGVRRDPAAAVGPLTVWLVRSQDWAGLVTSGQGASLYDPGQLAKAAGQGG
jgi:hypothetical protein